MQPPSYRMSLPTGAPPSMAELPLQKISRTAARKLRKHRKQIAQVGLVGCVSEQRRYVEDLLESAQGRSVRVVNGVLVSVAFGKLRENDHSDRAIARRGFVPGDKDRATIPVSSGVEDRRQIL